MTTSKYLEVVNLHKNRVFNLYIDEDHSDYIETSTTYLFFSSERYTEI